MRCLGWLGGALVVALVPSISMGQAPVPKEVLAHFAKRVGDWKLDGKMLRTPFAGTASVRWAAGNHCLIQTRTSWPKADPRALSREVSIIGWDASTGEIVEQMFSTRGDVVTWRSKLKAAASAEGELTHVHDGKRITANFRWTEKSPGRWHYRGWRGPFSAAEFEMTRTASAQTRQSARGSYPARPGASAVSRTRGAAP